MAAPSPKEPPKKKKRLEDQFSAVATAEETTRQKELEVAKVRAEAEKAKVAAKLEARKAQLADQRDDRRSKSELLRLKLEQKHQLRMAKMQLKYGAGAQQNIPTQAPRPSVSTPSNTTGFHLTDTSSCEPTGGAAGPNVFSAIPPHIDTSTEHSNVRPASPSITDFGGSIYSDGTRSSSPASGLHNFGDFDMLTAHPSQTQAPGNSSLESISGYSMYN